MSAAEKPEAPAEGRLQVVLALLPGMPLVGSMRHLANVTCQGLDAPGAFLLLDPKTFALVLCAPCGCSVTLDLPGAIGDLRQMVLMGHAPGGAGPLH